VSRSRPPKKPRQQKRRITKKSIKNINTIGGGKRRRSRLARLSCQTVLKAIQTWAWLMPWTVEGFVIRTAVVAENCVRVIRRLSNQRIIRSIMASC
jgi:hypothetical protein